MLRARLVRQTRRFGRWFRPGLPPPRWRLALYEVTVRGGLDLLWAVLLRVPGLADWLRSRLRPGLSCAFLGYEDGARRRVGCLLHPTRWGGREFRAKAAFALLRGIGCGEPGYYCTAAHWFAGSTWQERREFSRRAAGLGWIEYSRAAAAYRRATASRPGLHAPASPTPPS